MNSLRHFKDFFKLNAVFRADETEWLENLSIFPGNLIYKHSHFIFMVFFFAMVSEDLFDTFTAKGINLYQCTAFSLSF